MDMAENTILSSYYFFFFQTNKQKNHLVANDEY